MSDCIKTISGFFFISFGRISKIVLKDLATFKFSILFRNETNVNIWHNSLKIIHLCQCFSTEVPWIYFICILINCISKFLQILKIFRTVLHYMYFQHFIVHFMSFLPNFFFVSVPQKGWEPLTWIDRISYKKLRTFSKVNKKAWTLTLSVTTERHLTIWMVNAKIKQN